MVFTRKELRTALKSASFKQRGGQSVKELGMKTPKYEMTAKQQKDFLKESGLSKQGIKSVLKAEQAQQTPKEQPRFESRKMEVDVDRPANQPATKNPEWVEKVENPGEQAPQKTFGKQINEDVRIDRAGQNNQQVTKGPQPTSDVDRSRFQQSDIDRMENKGQDEYVDKAAQTRRFDDLDKADADEATKIDQLLGGGTNQGGGTEGGGGAER